MPKCHKIYPNCFWQVPAEWFGLNFTSALLAKVYWNYPTHFFCAGASPIIPHLVFSKKNNIQVKFGSRAMARLYELLCHKLLTNSDPLLEKLFSHLPT